MDIDEAIQVIEKILQPAQFGSIERFVFRQSWLGQTYSEMAEDSGYGSIYIKEIGSQLWQNLSESLGDRVTKKNLHLVFSQCQSNWNNEQQSQLQQNWQKDIEIGDNSWALESKTEMEFPSAPLPYDSPLYTNRPPIEELALAEVSKPGCTIRIKATKKMGKSSLLNQILAYGARLEYKSVYLDFQEADETVFANLDRFLRWLCINVSKRLNLEPRLEDYWDEEMGSKVSCKIYFEGYLLEQVNCPIVLAFNEVDRVFEHPNIAQDFLPMLRFWHEQARQVEVWQKLRLAIAHSTEVYVPLKLNQSPFNIGLSITLPQFTLQQVQQLAQRYGLDWWDETGTKSAKSLIALVGGHPYLVSVALYYLSRGEMTLSELLQAAPTQAGIYSHYLRNYLALLQNEPELAAALQQVVTANQSVQLKALTAYKLESMGLIELDEDLAKASCELYRLYFRKQIGVELAATVDKSDDV